MSGTYTSREFSIVSILCCPVFNLSGNLISGVYFMQLVCTCTGDRQRFHEISFHIARFKIHKNVITKKQTIINNIKCFYSNKKYMQN